MGESRWKKAAVWLEPPLKFTKILFFLSSVNWFLSCWAGPWCAPPPQGSRSPNPPSHPTPPPRARVCVPPQGAVGWVFGVMQGLDGYTLVTAHGIPQRSGATQFIPEAGGYHSSGSRGRCGRQTLPCALAHCFIAVIWGRAMGGPRCAPCETRKPSTEGVGQLRREKSQGEAPRLVCQSWCRGRCHTASK